MIRARAHRSIARTLGLLLVLACTAGTGVARADDPVAAAEALFQDGRKLMEAKKYAQACAKFAASQKLDPRSGTLLNLADCYEKNGQIASAWARFREAETLARRQNRLDRAQTAKERAELLEPKLPKLTIELAGQSGDVEVKRDGIVVDPGAFGSSVPVDPGKHTIEASAKGKKPWSTIVDVRTTSNVRVPVLEPSDEPVAPAGNVPFEQPVTTEGTPKKAEQSGGGSGATQKTIGLVAAGVGVLGLGVGSAFGLSAKSKWDDAQGHCSNGECDADGVSLASDAKSAGNMSTVFFLAGGVLLAGGAALYFTAPSSKSSLSAGVTPTGVLFRGAF
jgi:hypothetical protein